MTLRFCSPPPTTGSSYIGSSLLTRDYYCYPTASAAYSVTSCSYTQIMVDYNRNGACSAASYGFIFYCPAISPVSSSYYTGSASSTNGYCYSTSSQAYSSTACYTSQIANDNYRSGACSSAPSSYTFYCPITAYTTSSTYLGTLQTSNGYCYATYSAASSATYCTQSISSDSYHSGACAGASAGYIYYCPANSYRTGSSLTSDGVCYASSSLAYSSTSCSTSQITTDYSRAGACSGAPSGIYYYWCECSAQA